MKVLTDKQYTEAIKQAETAKEAELKGYYTSQQEETATYIKILESQIRRHTELPVQRGIQRSELKDLYERNAVVHGLVNLIARNVGECSKYLELLDRNGKVVENHWIVDLLNHPNDRFSRAKYFTAYSISKDVYGDAFTDAPKAVGRNRGRISEMYLLPSDKVGIKHGDWERLFEGLVINGKTINADEVFESFYYNLDDTSYFGFSKLVASALYLSVLEKSMGREDKSLENGGVANLITPANSTLPALGDDKDSAEQELNAHKNINRNLFLRMPIEVHELGNKPVDLSILDSHKEAVTALCFVYGIPVDCYYGQSKYENAREAKKQIYEQCAIPALHEWGEDFLNYVGLAGEFSLVVNTDKIDILQDSPYDVASKMNSCGAFTTNEIREASGWEARTEPWCDEVRLPMGVQIGNAPIDFTPIPDNV